MTKNLWLKLLESQLCLDQDWGPRRLHTFFLLIIWIHAYRVVCPCWVLTEPNRVVHGHSRSGQSRLLLSFPPRPLTRSINKLKGLIWLGGRRFICWSSFFTWKLRVAWNQQPTFLVVSIDLFTVFLLCTSQSSMFLVPERTAGFFRGNHYISFVVILVVMSSMILKHQHTKTLVIIFSGVVLFLCP